MISQQIGFIGAGQMAQALAQGIVRRGGVDERQILAHDPSESSREQFLKGLPGAVLLPSNEDLIQQAEVIMLAVKPQALDAVTGELGRIPAAKLVVSVLAGVSLATLADRVGSERVVRVMPNTPCLLGVGASGYALGPAATPEDGQLVGGLLSSVGIAFEVPEALLDGVTGLSGSGPAFVYTIIEALSDGGVRVGLPRATATALAAQTVLGAAKMVLETAEHTGVLRDRVTSPGGTTIAGLQALEQHGLRAALIDAVVAAATRSKELGKS
jgi:pyrroline-5-carboxylate reductase